MTSSLVINFYRYLPISTDWSVGSQLTQINLFDREFIVIQSRELTIRFNLESRHIRNLRKQKKMSSEPAPTPTPGDVVTEEIIQKVEEITIDPAAPADTTTNTTTNEKKEESTTTTTTTTTDEKTDEKSNEKKKIPNPKTFTEFQEVFEKELETIRSEDKTLRFDAMVVLRKYLMPGKFNQSKSLDSSIIFEIFLTFSFLFLHR